MGALHAGHLALCKKAAAFGAPVVVTIFVNPTQFGPGEDFGRYPRTLEQDLEQLRSLPTPPAAVFVPRLEDIYPDGVEHATGRAAQLQLPPCATEPQLEDRCRPGHFAGVALVVGRLFDLALPTLAFFGEKDFQQLRLVEELVASHPDRFGYLRVIRCPTIREAEGLAMSSRNRYLSEVERPRALGLSRALHAALDAPTPAAAEERMTAVLRDHGLSVEYAVVRHEQSLMPLAPGGRAGRALIAARLGSVRLIDNARWGARGAVGAEGWPTLTECAPRH